MYVSTILFCFTKCQTVRNFTPIGCTPKRNSAYADTLRFPSKLNFSNFLNFFSRLLPAFRDLILRQSGTAVDVLRDKIRRRQECILANERITNGWRDLNGL